MKERGKMGRREGVEREEGKQGGRKEGKEKRLVGKEDGWEIDGTDVIFDCVAVELQDMVSSPTQVKSTVQLESRNGNTGLEIDWGEMAADEITPEQSDRTGFEESEIDFNIDAVDLSVITVEDSGEGEEERGSSVTVIPETSEGEDLEPEVTQSHD